MNRAQPKLPVGDKPGWELYDSDDQENLLGLRSIAESSVILQSLRQSRDKWMSSTFPKFSSKARGGKPPEIVPLPHTIQTRGRCDIEIGPHTFSNTTIFEVHYLPPQQPVSPSKPEYPYQSPHSISSSSWQATTPYGGLNYSTYGKHNPAQKASTSESISQSSSKPLLSSLTSSVSITPTLINQVNSAASSNPTLANLLQLAAAGKANPDQLKTLGLLIQSLATPFPDVDGNASSSFISQPTSYTSSTRTDSQTVSYGSQNSPYALLPPVREFDIVIEFQESSSERWIFPRGHVVCERILDTWSADATYDILISTGVPFATGASRTPGLEKTEVSGDDLPSQLVTFHFKKAPIAVWDTISRWAGSEDDMKMNRKILEKLKPPERIFLGLQLPQGPLLTQIQNAANPSYNTKSIKPGQGAASRPKRKPQRKPPAVGMDSPTPTTPVPKRRRQMQPKNAPTMNQIACFTCGQVDVPLIMGGRFCRPCADAGKATADIPQAGSSRLTYKLSTFMPPTIPATSLSDNVTQPPSLDSAATDEQAPVLAGE